MIILKDMLEALSDGLGDCEEDFKGFGVDELARRLELIGIDSDDLFMFIAKRIDSYDAEIDKYDQQESFILGALEFFLLGVLAGRSDQFDIGDLGV